MANSDPTPLALPPGMLRSTTDADAGPRYVDGYHVRFQDGKPEKMLGFVKYIAEQTLGVVHGAYAWVTIAGNRLLAIGDYIKAYSVLDDLDDITPLRDSGTLATDPFAIVSGDATVTVTDVAHGLEDGAYVHFSGADVTETIASGGSNFGTATSGGGLAAAFDGTTSQAAAACANASGTAFYVGKSLAAGAQIDRAIVYGSNDAGFVTGSNPTITLTLYAKQGAAPLNVADGTVLGTLSFTDTADESAGRTVDSDDVTTVWDHCWIRVDKSGGAALMHCAELQIITVFDLNVEHIVTVVDPDTYTIEHVVVAPATDATFGGAAVDYEYEINPGLADSVIGLGVGVGPVGEGTVGTPRTSGGILRRMRTWFFDRYGSFLLVHPSGGTICLWDEPNADDRAEPIAGSPASARASFVTAEGMIVALGTTTPMTLQWCDRDDNTNWTPSETSTANIRTVRTGNELVAGTRFPGDGGQCFWSDTAFYGMQFIDSSSFIYETTVLAYDAGLIAPTAYELTRDLILWLTPSLELMLYNGSVTPAPRWAEISEDFKTRFDTARADKLTFGHVPAKNTVVCYYTSISSADGENDEFFEVNLLDWSYTIGPRTTALKVFKRSAQVHMPTAGGAVIATGNDRYIYQHEVGVDADGEEIPWSLRTGRLTIMEGAVDSDVNGYIPDCQRQVGDIVIDVRLFERPNSVTPIDEQSFSFAPGTEIVDMVAGGRYADFEWSGEGIGCDFRFGKPLLDVAAAGRSR